MTLTLADLARWDPNAIHSVFQAAIDRANGVRNTATQIGDVMATTPWEGDSHDAAMGATGRIQDDLLSHAEQCEAVGRAARAAEAEVPDSLVQYRRSKIAGPFRFAVGYPGDPVSRRGGR
jgi:hypothetical protein